jgi:hypothetical protein
MTERPAADFQAALTLLAGRSSKARAQAPRPSRTRPRYERSGHVGGAGPRRVGERQQARSGAPLRARCGSAHAEREAIRAAHLLCAAT